LVIGLVVADGTVVVGVEVDGGVTDDAVVVGAVVVGAAVDGVVTEGAVVVGAGVVAVAFAVASNVPVVVAPLRLEPELLAIAFVDSPTDEMIRMAISTIIVFLFLNVFICFPPCLFMPRLFWHESDRFARMLILSRPNERDIKTRELIFINSFATIISLPPRQRTVPCFS
jgi:hypothetical protein